VRVTRKLCEQHNISPDTVRNRMAKGMTLEQALNTPLQHHRVPISKKGAVRGIGMHMPEWGYLRYIGVWKGYY